MAEEQTTENENLDQPVEQEEEVKVEDESPKEEETTEETTDAPESEDEGEEETKEDEETETKDEESEEDESEESEEESEAEYNEYEHPALKQAVNLLKDAEVSVEDANSIFQEAVDSGDLSKINKDKLVELVGEEKSDVILVLAESYYTTQFSEFKAVLDEAHKIAGGEETYNAMKDWAAEKATSDPEFAKDMQEFRSMIDSGNPRAVRAAVRELFDIYKQDPDTTISADLEEGTSTPNTTGLQPLTLREYTKLITKARKDGTYEKVHKGLWARRQAGKKQGI